MANSAAYDESARQLVKLAARALKRQHPLFILVQYNHQADKLDFLTEIRTRLASAQINTRQYDPHNNTEHGVSQLYPLLKQDAAEQALSLVVSMPRKPDSDELAADFLSYINLHRDSIAHDKLHWVLFLRDTEMAAFIRGASDLWSFCHRTFWLERELEKSADMLWQNFDAEPALKALTDEENLEVKAHVKTVKQLVDETADNEDKARLLLDLSRWLGRHNAPQFAIEVGLEGIRLLNGQVCDLLAELENNAGLMLLEIGAYPEALNHYKASLAISRQVNNRGVEGAVFNNISRVHYIQGDYEAALAYLKKSLAIQKETDNKAGECVTLNNIAQIYQGRGNYDVSLDYLEQAFAIQQDIKDQAALGNILNRMGTAYYHKRNIDTALNYFNRALVISRDVGDKSRVGESLNNIATVYIKKSEHDNALDYLKQSLDIVRDLRDKEREGVILSNISQLYDVRGDYVAALEYAKQAETVQMAIGEKAGLCATLFNMGHLYWKSNQQKEALSVWQRSYQMAKSMELAQVLTAFEKLAEKVDLPAGFDEL